MNIDNDDEAIAFEQKRAAELGMDMISKPLSAFKPPHHSTVDEILEIISDSKRYPLFLHCKHGEDRTGMIAGLYRVEYQNWSPQDAYEEMKNLGFHKVLVALTHYFKRRTGYDDLRSKPWLSFSPFELNMNIE